MNRFQALLFILSASIASSGIAKANGGEPVKMTLFAQFENGYVILNNNAKIPAKLNYDLVEERMLFLETDNSLNELDAAFVAVAVIGKGEGERSFIPAGGKAFYERILIKNAEYYIRHKTKILSRGKSSGYGSYSQTASIGGLTISNNTGTLYQLEPEEKTENIDEPAVFIKDGKKFEKINSLKSLLRLFKSHQTEIEAYSQKHNPDFKKSEDVKTIVEYVFSLQ